MRKLRLVVVLPILQVLVTSLLLQWGHRAVAPRFDSPYMPTGWLICRGLNAPTLVFWFFDQAMRVRYGVLPWDWVAPGSNLGFGKSDLFYLVEVAVVWYFVGQALDRRLNPRMAGNRGVATTLVVHTLLLALGGLLFVVGLRELALTLRGAFNNLDPPVGALLAMTWSVSLIFLSGRGVVRGIRNFRASTQPGGPIAGGA